MPITTPEQLALAKRVRDHIKANPGQHKQQYYYRKSLCGTTACVAGWTAVLNDADLITTRGVLGIAAADVRTKSGDTEDIWDYARDQLGLDTGEAPELFSLATSEADALAYLEQLIADAETRLSGAAA